ncbi:MAG: hypothetical protein AAB426_12575, partial [Myxococcota bacterium]
QAIEAALEYQGGPFHALRFVPRAAGEYLFSIVATEAGRENGNSTTVTFRMRVRDGDGGGGTPLWQVTPLWVGENDFASKGATEAGPLIGIEPGATDLKSDQIMVTGKEPFASGHQALDAHATRTYYHDSFTQAQLFHVLQRMADLYTSFDLGMKYGELVGAKSGKTHAEAHANAMEQINAYYMPTTEATNFGIAIVDGKPIWDLGADSNVTLHEAGHYNLDHLLPGLSYWGDAGALHEGFGDAQAAFLSRDPEISEDFGKVDGKPGEPLRNVVNDATIDNTSDEVHDRGKVFGAMMWEVGEQLHTAITGKSRERIPVDAEPLDAEAAHAALKIIWTMPLYLGSRSPTRRDFVRALHQAVDSLAAAGKLPAQVDLKRLHASVDVEASKRGLSAPRTQPVGDPIPITVSTGRGPDVEGLRAAGLDPRVFSTALVSQMRGPSGEVVQRYEVRRKLNVEGRSGVPVNVPIEDDLLTVIRGADGAYSAQVGLLKKYGETPAPSPAPNGDAVMAVKSGLEVAGDKRTLSLGASEESVLAQLRSYAERDLARQLDPSTRSGIVAGVGDKTSSAQAQTREYLAREAQQRLVQTAGADAPSGKLVWRHGTLSARLELGTLTYYAAVLPDGTLLAPVAEKAVICDATHWQH